MSGYYSEEELQTLRLASIGKNVKISRQTSIYSPNSISIGDHVRIDDFCILSGIVQIGSYVHIAAYCGLYGKYGIIIRDFSGLSSRVSIYSGTDDYSGRYLTNPTVPEKYKNTIGGEVILDKHVIIGASTVILPKVKIGEGTAVGSLSLVTYDLEPWKIYGGVPCKLIKDREKGALDWERLLREEVKKKV